MILGTYPNCFKVLHFKTDLLTSYMFFLFATEYLVIPNESNNDFWIGLNTGTWTDGSPLGI